MKIRISIMVYNKIFKHKVLVENVLEQKILVISSR